MFGFIITALYFYLPGALANIGSNIGRFIPLFKDIVIPIDLNTTYKGKRLIGSHKLYGSFIFGILFGTSMGILKYYFLDTLFDKYLLLSLKIQETILLYFVMSFGALTGDILKSIIKRRLGRPEHTPWIPFDEIDHSTISMLLVSLFFPIPVTVTITVIIGYFLMHLLSNLIGFKLGIKDVPY